MEVIEVRFDGGPLHGVSMHLPVPVETTYWVEIEQSARIIVEDSVRLTVKNWPKTVGRYDYSESSRSLRWVCWMGQSSG